MKKDTSIILPVNQVQAKTVVESTTIGPKPDPLLTASNMTQISLGLIALISISLMLVFLIRMLVLKPGLKRKKAKKITQTMGIVFLASVTLAYFALILYNHFK